MNPEVKTILLVEDEAIIALARSRMLEKNNFHVVIAHDAVSAISAVTEKPYINLVLMDINLGNGMDGIDAARVILRDRALPIIFLSSHSEKEIVKWSEEIASYGYMNKNVDENILIASITVASRLYEENQTRQTRENYEAFFNTIDEFLFVLDMQGNILHTNSTVIDRLGYSSGELSGKPVLMVHPPDRREEAGAIVAAMLAGKAEYCPVPLITKAGVQIAVETRVSLGRWDGQPAIFGVSKDITRLKLSEEKFSKLFNLNPSCCGLSDVPTGKYVEVNEAFTRLLGYDSGSVIGKSAIELGILDDAAKSHILSKADKKGNIYNVEGELTTKKGDKKQVLMSAENIHVQDKRYRLTVIHDISAQKKAERRNLALVEEKNLLLREVHHRIKNNMGTMMSLLSLQAAQAEDPGAVNALVNAQSRLKSMGVLYDKLYRSESLTEMAIDQYLTALVMEIVATFPNSGKVSVRYAMDSWKMNPKILSNLGIIINEIISNSMKYAFNDKAEGTITISAQLVDGLATIGIADNGSGIPECIDPEHSPGFGLEMVRMLAEQMGGTFRYERCRGTRFLLEFKAEAS